MPKKASDTNTLIKNTEKRVKKNEKNQIKSKSKYREEFETKHGAELGRIMQYLDAVRGTTMPKFDTPEEMELAIQNWWYACLDNETFPTKRGLALALGVSWKTLKKWGDGEKGEAYAEIIQRLDETLAELDEQAVLSGVVNPVTYIFRAKNYHGLKDRQEIETSSTEVKTKTREELEKEYLSSLPQADYEIVDNDNE